MHMPSLDLAAFDAALLTRDIGHNVVYRDVVDSTMDVARQQAAFGAPHGTLVVAEMQTAGRGRRGRSFHSPAGENLYFTLILRLDEAAHRALPVAVPLAVCRAVRATGVEARIKWPNDIWAGERKLAGMLIDAETTPAGPVAYPGIGINVNGDPTLEPSLRDIATSIRRELGRPVSREALLARCCNALEDALDRSPAERLAAYRDLSMILGREVTVHPANAEPYPAVALTIASDGSLVVTLPDGSIETVTAADVSIRPR
jgi:BirA family biotin operon repressor/biotin-[acetyl-CoA-carboxylase] ligase